MNIIGFNITKVFIERKNPIKGKLEIKSKVDIEDITPEEIPISDKPALNFKFSYLVEYEPNFAKIEIKGSLLALDEKDDSKEIIKEWKTKKFTHELKVPIFNFIMNKCNLRAIQLEDDLGLPLHIPFPQVAPQSAEAPKPDKKTSYTG